MSGLVKIDGSLGEGGGQVLRIALSLSALYKIPIEIENIRAGRPKPGLAAQHLKGVEIAQSMCNAQVKGGYPGSTRLEFIPGVISKTQKRTFHADTQTAGCICLLAQVALPIALFLPPGEPITLVLKGGTNVPMGPHIEYFTEVFRPWLNKLGADFDFTVLKRGYYPKGGGEVHLRIPPVKSLNSVEMLHQGEIKSISGWAYVAGSVHLSEAYNMAEVTKNTIHRKLTDNNIPVPSINIESYREDREMAVGNGSGINVVCQLNSGSVIGGSGLGSNRRDNKSDPAVEAAEQIVKPILDGSCIDEHMQDQMVLLMALAHGRSRLLLGKQQLTQHTETAIKVAELMLGNRGFRCQVTANQNAGDSKQNILECDGCGLTNAVN
ncbi:RNA 3'-terminal phosphate cyclase [Microplitis demolitor]|uniref:RNA 3'-terminal phosphate cyclase n=1 Tax=Microplitis demolitor TaxID=69319 RepID=UPI000440008C|nr:RNA 3'-terminal phosphate cyclase [Microplitis demolitor]